MINIVISIWLIVYSVDTLCLYRELVEIEKLIRGIKIVNQSILIKLTDIYMDEILERIGKE